MNIEERSRVAAACKRIPNPAAAVMNVQECGGIATRGKRVTDTAATVVDVEVGGAPASGLKSTGPKGTG